jgi:hypothetical protein
MRPEQMGGLPDAVLATLRDKMVIVEVGDGAVVWGQRFAAECSILDTFLTIALLLGSGSAT